MVFDLMDSLICPQPLKNLVAAIVWKVEDSYWGYTGYGDDYC